MFGVTMLIPSLRKMGYDDAMVGSEVLSTRTARPGALERYAAISFGFRVPDLMTEEEELAVFQSEGVIEGE